MVQTHHHRKELGTSASGTTGNIFRQARLKLALLYIVIIGIVVIISSVALYYSLANNIYNNFEGDGSDQAQALLVLKTTNQLQETIFFIDFIVLCIAGGFGYFLAGKTLDPIQEAMDKQKQFTADASHELRTPLSVMRTNLEVALREKEWNKEKSREFIASTLEEVIMMTTLTEDLLFLTNLEQVKKTFISERIYVSKLLTSVVESMHALALDQHIYLSSTHIESGYVMGDKKSLWQLFMNIIGNAIKFTPPHGSVFVALKHHDGRIIITTQDTGIGIHKEDINHVFERLYRSDKARTHNMGMGLGLSIAQEIVSLHKGTITIDSEPEKGTLVTIVLPATQ